MLVLLDEIILVHDGFVSLAPEGESPDFTDARSGQNNGLCGAGTSGMLSMVTGLHTGAVPFRIELHPQAPPLSDGWEDVVEASIDVPDVAMTWWAFDEGGSLVFERTGPHRARYHACCMDAAYQADARDEDAAEIDRYLLQLWPAPMAPDAVLRRTSEQAAYWHSVARGETT